MRIIKQTTIFFVLLLLGACGAQNPTPDPNVIQPTSAPNLTPVATQPPPVFSLPTTRITSENANQLQYLGRLDPYTSIPSTVFSHALSPDGTRLAALNNELFVVWDLVQGGIAFSESRGNNFRVYYAPDRSEIYTVAGDGLITIHEPDRGTDINTLQAGIQFNGVVTYYEPNGWLAMGGSDGSIQVWDAYNRLSQVTFPAHTAPLNALTFSQDGTLLASAGQDGKVIIWDWVNRTAVNTFDVQSAGIITIALSPDKTQMTIAGVDYSEIYSLTSNQFLYTIAIGTNPASAVVQYSPDGKYIITGGTDAAEMSILEAQSGNIIAQLPQTQGERTSAAFSQDSDLLVTTVVDGGVSLWNVGQATESSIPSARLLVGSTRITSVEWSEDGFALAFFDGGGSVYLWGVKE